MGPLSRARLAWVIALNRALSHIVFQDIEAYTTDDCLDLLLWSPYLADLDKVQDYLSQVRDPQWSLETPQWSLAPCEVPHGG